jgi:hypothetical protein
MVSYRIRCLAPIRHLSTGELYPTSGPGNYTLLRKSPSPRTLEAINRIFTDPNKMFFVGSANSMETYEKVIKDHTHLPQVIGNPMGEDRSTKRIII